jgi:LAS superfamily LD-carboxypeptidase LdcB
MRESRGKRIVLALLMLAFLSSYLYLEVVGAQSLPLPEKVIAAVQSEAPGTPETQSRTPEPGTGAEPTIPEQTQTAQEAEPVQLPVLPGLTTAEPQPTVDPNTPYGKALANAAARGLPTPPDIDISSWEFTLVNGDHSIDRYEPEQLAYLHQTLAETDIQTAYNGNRCPVDIRIAEPLIAMGQGCKEAGHTVYLSSGYRSYNDQAANFQRICQNNGISDGKDYAGHYITMPPGCSEHQLALCCDITDRYYETKTPEKVASPTIDWLLEHCAEYGFVQRFPSGKEDITGVMNETWHFRYVGVEAAVYMTENELTLEEFLGLYGVE